MPGRRPPGGSPTDSASRRQPSRSRQSDVPRVTLTISEAAAALGISNDTFRRFVLPELRVVQASPRLMLVRVAELERWATRREALADLD